ncbi:MAG: alanine--tRNA ligase [Symbiobacteriia bacterium]
MKEQMTGRDMKEQMTGAAVREKFLKFFEDRGHTIVPSGSLVPHDDPTLLFTNAGMNQFKDVFLGKDVRPYKRATTAQKCVRAGGKHNDLDSVGRTARHHTFFEMMGNFSFGDYFKRDAITFAWEFVTEVMGLPKERLYATVFRDDDEAYQLWEEISGLPPERIKRLGEKDNFWAMGDTGPCGPCSEIHIDMGPEYTCDAPECALGVCDCDRWREIWNLVFMQYDRDAQGVLHPLPRPSVDTGMGLERMTSVMQGVYSNYDTDLFTPLLQHVEKITGKSYDRGPAGMPFRVIADHARACTFLIADGVVPSNDGRGYVLRRILRRAVRFGKVLGIDQPFLYSFVPVVVSVMGDAYPEVRAKQDEIMQVIRLDEERFQQTLSDGMRRAEEIVAVTKAGGQNAIAGRDAFLLYDTYGFPFDLTEDIAEEHGLTVDKAGFDAAMTEQRQRARAARKDLSAHGAATQIAQVLKGLPVTTFTGYGTTSGEGTILAVLSGDERVGAATAGDEVTLVLDTTPFYAESGGQIGDTGRIEGLEAASGAAGGQGGLALTVSDTQKGPEGRVLHYCQVEAGVVREGQRVRLSVDAGRRRAIMRNHTATHLLHKALRTVLGTHVEQKGSYVGPDRLRFDFSHLAPVSGEELAKVEAMVNAAALENLAVTTTETSLEEARKLGAMALFGEKYGSRVRLVRAEDFSMELCGGIHVGATAEIGAFKIVSESGIGSGLRRIEAVTGGGSVALLKSQEDTLEEVAGTLKTRPEDLLSRVQELVRQLKDQEKELAALQGKMAHGAADELLDAAVEVGGARVIVGQAPVADMDGLRSLADLLLDRAGSGIVVLGTGAGDKVSLVVKVSADLVTRGLHAGKLIKEVAAVTGGSGGGRPDMAQAGGKDPAKLGEALERARELVKSQLA